jgi:hypothetical protein
MSDTITYLPVQTMSGMPCHGFKLKEETMIKLVVNLDPNVLQTITSLFTDQGNA